MFLSLLQFFATKFLVLALHLESGSFPRPLSAREETEAFSALRAGDPAAREKLIRHNLRLVAHIVKKYYALPGDQDDLISIGTIGLMKAVDTFDSARRARFSTYASRCIENEICRSLAGRPSSSCRIRRISSCVSQVSSMQKLSCSTSASVSAESPSDSSASCSETVPPVLRFRRNCIRISFSMHRLA